MNQTGGGVTRITVANDARAAASIAAQRMASAIAAGRRQGRPVSLALAGGRTPRAAYERLAQLVGDWGAAELWLGDERMVAPDDPESNFRMVTESLVERTGALLHGVPTSGSAEEAADAYGYLLRASVPAGPSGLPALDFALLGVGEDGHTASLFPHSPALEAEDVCVAVHDAPKPPRERVSLSLPTLRAARQRLMLAVGEHKAQAVAALTAIPDPGVPASLLVDEALELVLDLAAAQALPEDAIVRGAISAPRIEPKGRA